MMMLYLGISKYGLSNPRLDAVPQNIANMKDLWLNKFTYDTKYVNIVTEEINSEFVTLESLTKEFDKIHQLFNLKQGKECDGLIFICSGVGSINGLDNYVLCSDSEKLPILNIQNKYYILIIAKE